MTTPTEDQRRTWMAQWRSAAVALEHVRLDELRSADLGRIAAGLEDACARVQQMLESRRWRFCFIGGVANFR